ncbi:MAG: MG2 domain-containing protein, partial [Isosphaeraceae bacterium]
LVIDGDHVAGSDLGVPETVSQGLTARAYLYTDRPAYRPGQSVELRGVVREVVKGQYANVPKATYRLEVTDSRGRSFVAKVITLSDFGTFHESLTVDDGAPVGTYRVRVYQPGKSEFTGQFEVQAYKLEKVALKIDLPKTVYFRGETIEGDVIATYQYGTPLAGRPIFVGLPDGRTLQGTTDASGKYHISMETTGFAEEQALRLVAQLPQDNVATAATVMLAVRAFSIETHASRDVYLDGESFRVEVKTDDAQGEPTGQPLSAKVLKQVEVAGRTTEREVETLEVKTDSKTGKGSITLKIDDADGGRYIVRLAGTDRFGNPVVQDLPLTISGKKDETKLRILADRQEFKVGEEAAVRLHNRDGASTALLTWESDRILSYKVVSIKEGDNPLSWTVDGAQFPNFTLTAARMAETRFDEARLDVKVTRDLQVSITPTKDAVGPGDDVEVEVTTRDQLGQPVAAELSMALVDEALLRLFQDNQPPIGQFFYDQERTGAFATESTNTFRYEPTSIPVPEAVAEEDAKQALIQLGERDKDAANFGGVTETAPSALAVISADSFGALPAPSAGMPAEEKSQSQLLSDSVSDLRSGMMGGMGGGMGAMSGPRAAGRPERESLARKRSGPQLFGRQLAENGAVALGKSELALPRAPSELDFQDELSYAFRARRTLGVDAVQTPRQSFIETAYWNPSVVTGKDGKARVTFKAPTALSRYRFTSRGVTGADTLAGQATAELRVRKDFFVDLKVPSVLTQGDKPRFSAQLHHGGDGQGDATLRLAIYAGGRDQVIPKTIPIKGAGVEEVLFDPFEVPDGDVVRLELKASLGDQSDTLVVEVPIRSWGVQAFASSSGTASDDVTSFLALPSGREYENPEMQIVLSPTLRRMLVELALGRDAYPLDRKIIDCFPIPPDTLADRASDLLAAVSALGYLRNVGGADAPEATRLSDRVRSLAAELVTRQNDDGGWPWTKGGSNPDASARATWALAAASPLGLVPSIQALDKAVTYLTGEFPKVESSDHDTRAAILHALATRHRATFEQANALNRLRQGLSDIALAYLALTFHELDRKGLGGEVLDVLGPKSKTESAGPSLPPRRYWEGKSPHPFHRGPAEATALAALAYAQLRPESSELNGAVAWLLAHRVGNGWQPHKTKGPALAALASYYGKAKGAEDRYRLVVTVNDETVSTIEVVGSTEGTSLRVPTRALKAGGKNRVHFGIEGRGTFGYAITLTGFTRNFEPDQTPANRPFVIQRRVYRPAEPELDGKTLPSGFGVAVNPTHFENTISQLPQGGRARVAIDAYRVQRAGQPAWERDFLVLEEHLPAGSTLVDGSIQSPASHHELVDGVLTLYFAPDQWPSCTYEVFGYLPGDYRALPARLRSAYEPGRLHLGNVGSLKVLPPGEQSTDPYKPTPDELYARGKGLFDADRLTEAASALEALWSAYTLRDDVAKDAARMLLVIHIKKYEPRKVVQYFEILKEKAPELVIPFDQIRVIGKAYADIGEHERAYLVWRATAEASYLEDARVGEVLRQRGKTLEGVAFLLDLWREYPGTASIEADFFGLSQVLASLATRAVNDPGLRRELLDAGVSRDDLLTQEVRLIQAFLTLSPKSPLADEASLALTGAFLEREDYESVVTLSKRFAGLYPKSTFLDSFQYSEALGLFHLGQYDRAINVAEAIAKATYKDASGVDQPSPNKWQALYILGQIYDARRRPSQAVAYYKRVADRFTDAADAVRDLTRKALTLPEVSVLRPTETPKPGGVGLRSMPFEQAVAPLNTAKSKVELAYRNIAEADVKVYPVDLMRLYLARRSL